MITSTLLLFTFSKFRINMLVFPICVVTRDDAIYVKGFLRSVSPVLIILEMRLWVFNAFFTLNNFKSKKFL